jgi:lysyl-tRNA synthetase class II/uncharacterized membrane protein
LTKHGETTLLVKEYTLLSKTLRPLPEKFHGLADTETKYRYRYLDLLSEEETWKRFQFRTALIREIRQYLDQHGFAEVETPILTSIASGAAAMPFATHHQALDIPMYLRIAPETYLKRCIVGGYDRVYEFAKCFRNEGIDPSHLQEFTMLEYYASYWDFQDNMDFTEAMIKQVLQKLSGTTKVQTLDRDGQAVEIDFGGKWPRLNFAELIKNDCGIDILDHYSDAKSLLQAIKAANIKIEKAETMGYGNLCDALYKKVSRPHLIQPCFVIAYYSFLWTTVLMIPLFLWDFTKNPTWLGQISPAEIGILIFLVVASSIIAYNLSNWGLRYLSASISATIGYWSPIIAIGLSIAFLGEKPTVFFAIGSIITIFGLILTETRHKLRKQQNS